MIIAYLVVYSDSSAHLEPGGSFQALQPVGPPASLCDKTLVALNRREAALETANDIITAGLVTTRPWSPLIPFSPLIPEDALKDSTSQPFQAQRASRVRAEHCFMYAAYEREWASHGY